MIEERPDYPKPGKYGFSVIELGLVVALITVVAAVLVLALRGH